MRAAVVLLILGVLGTGCQKEQAKPTELPPEAVAQIEAQVISPPTSKLNAPIQERLEGAVHPGMTERLLYFEKTFQRMPTSFDELTARTMDSIPSAPPGLMYAIDPVDKAVKLVRPKE